MAKAIEMTSNTTDGNIDVGGVRKLLGINVTEDAASTAEVIIRNGGASGGKLARAKLASGGTHSAWFGPQGIDAPEGLYLDRVSGTTTVIVYVG